MNFYAVCTLPIFIVLLAFVIKSELKQIHSLLVYNIKEPLGANLLDFDQRRRADINIGAIPIPGFL
jgi:hypothetical protein